MSNDPIEGLVDSILDPEIPFDITNILIIGEDNLNRAYSAVGL